MNYRIKSKWLVVVGALLAQIAIGALYGWSMFNRPLSVAYGWEIEQAYTTYSIALASFALSMLLSGVVQLKIGPRKTALIGGVLYSGGILLSSLATTPIMLYLTYGVISGAGVAFVYVCPLSTLVKWFPEKKGTVTGLATAGFALGGFASKFLYDALLGKEGYTPEVLSTTFLTVGVIYAIMSIGGALLLDVPETSITGSKCKVTEGKDYTRMEMIKTGNFYKLLFSDMFALMPGLLVIGLAKDIGEQFVGLNHTTAATIVVIIALVNAAGRLASGSLADKLGALRVYRSMYAVTIVSLAILAFVNMNLPIFLVAIMGIAVGYGAFLSLVPTITNQLFGGKYFSANYAFVFQAYGVAALLGPRVKGLSSGFDQTFMIAMTTAVIGLAIAMTIKPTSQAQEDEQEMVTLTEELSKS